jgi:hypothetical protein
MRTFSISPAQMFISRASSARPRAVQREECEARLSTAILCSLSFLSTEIEVLGEALSTTFLSNQNERKRLSPSQWITVANRDYH